jgi:hypothetical protein
MAAVLRRTLATFGVGVVVAFAALVSGCVSVDDPTDTSARAMFDAKTHYEALLVAAVKYKRQPLCRSVSVPTCRDPRVVQIMQTADKDAEALLNNAEATVRDANATSEQKESAVRAAQISVASFGHLLVSYGVK